MEGIGQFTQSASKDEVPYYSKNGGLLTEEQRQAIADRRGICLHCNIKLFKRKGVIQRRPITNDDVYKGICIRCNPKKVPASLHEAWESRNKPNISAVSLPPPSATDGHSSPHQRLPSRPPTTQQANQSHGAPHMRPPVAQPNKATNTQSQHTINAQSQYTINPQSQHHFSSNSSLQSLNQNAGSSLNSDVNANGHFPNRTALGPFAGSQSSLGSSNSVNNLLGRSAETSENDANEEGFESTGNALEDEKARLGFKKTKPSTLPGVQSFNRESAVNQSDTMNNDDSSSSSSSTSSNETFESASNNNLTPGVQSFRHAPRNKEAYSSGHSNEQSSTNLPRNKQLYSSGTSVASSVASADTKISTTPSITDEKARYRHQASQRSVASSVASADTKNPTTRSITDEKARYRHQPSMRPGVQSVTSPTSNQNSEAELAHGDSGLIGPLGSQLVVQGRQNSDLSSLGMSKVLDFRFHDDYKGDEVKLSSGEYLNKLSENGEDPMNLRAILHNLRNAEDLSRKETLHVAKQLLTRFAGDSRILDVAAGLLWRVAATDDDAKIDVLHSGSIDVVLSCLHQGVDDPEFCQWSLGLLACVAYRNENKSAIAEKRGIEVVIEQLSTFGNNAGVCEWGSRCLYNLVFSYDDRNNVDPILSQNITSIEESGGIAIIVEALSYHDSEYDVMVWGMKLLWRMFGGGPSSRRLNVMHRMVVVRKFVQAGFVGLGQKLLTKHRSGEVQILTAALMAVVVLGSGSESNAVKLALLNETASRCVPGVIQGMSKMSDDKEMQAAGCSFLAAVSTVGGDMPDFLLENEAMDALSSAMMKFEDDLSIVEAGAWGLWKLSGDWKSANRSFPIGNSTIVQALGVLAGVAARHENEEKLHECLNGFAANVYGREGLEIDDFPIADIADTFFMFPSAGGAEILRVLCLEYAESCGMVVTSLGLPRIVDTLNADDDSTSCRLVPVLVTAGVQSIETRREMISSGVLSAALGGLQSSANKGLCSVLLDLITCLSTSPEADGSTSSPEVPQGFCGAIKSSFGELGQSDVDFHLRLLRTASVVVSQSQPTSETSTLFPSSIEAVSSRSVPVLLRVESCILASVIAGSGQITDRGQLTDALEKVIEFMREFNGESGQRLNLKVQEAAGGCLAGIAACLRYSPVPIDPRHIEIFMGSVYKTMPLKDQATQFMSIILTAMRNFCFVDEPALLQAGLIVIVMDIMSAFPNSAEIQEEGCAVLAQLASSENIHITLSIVETDGITHLVRALGAFPSNKGIATQASRALAHLSTDDETRILVSALGGITSLVGAVENFRNDQVLLERAFSALLNLTSDVPEHFLNMTQIARTIVKTMSIYPHSSSGLRENGLGILQNVCMKGAEAKEAVANEGGVSTVVNTMGNYITSATVLERGFSTLWSLAVLPANQGRIAQARGLEMVVSSMYASTEYERVQQQGCGCIFTLSLDPHNRLALRNAGCVEAIVLTAKAHFSSVHVQSEVTKCLACLSTPGEGSYQITSVSEEELDTILFAMTRYGSAEEIQVHGCQALLNFLKAGNSSAIIPSKKDSLMKAMETASSRFAQQCSEAMSDFYALIRQF